MKTIFALVLAFCIFPFNMTFAENNSYERFLEKFTDNAVFSPDNKVPIEIEASLFRYKNTVRLLSDLGERGDFLFLQSHFVKSFVDSKKSDRSKYFYMNLGKQRFPDFDVVFIRVWDENDDVENLDFGMTYYLFVTYTKEGKIISKIRFGEERGNFMANCVSQTYFLGNRIFTRTTPLDIETPQGHGATNEKKAVSKMTVFQLLDDGQFVKEKEYEQETSVCLRNEFRKTYLIPPGDVMELLIDGVSVKYPSK